MEYKYIKTSINNQILEVCINRPKQMNSINPQTSQELKLAFEKFTNEKLKKITINNILNIF